MLMAEPLRILCLHGYTQSGPQFSNKTGALRKALTAALAPRIVELHYPTGPLALRAEDIPGYSAAVAADAPASTLPAANTPVSATTNASTKEELEAYGWWRRQPHPPPSSNSSSATSTYTGLDSTFALLSEAIQQHGPFDGVLGFSQGACLAAMLCSLLDERVRRGEAEVALRREEEEAAARGQEEAFASQRDASTTEFPASFLQENGEAIQRPLKFAVLFAGFKAPGRIWGQVIGVRSLHVLGGLDVVVDEGRSRELIDVFREEGREVLVHPGGHFVPSAKVWTGAVTSFVRRCLDNESKDV